MSGEMEATHRRLTDEDEEVRRGAVAELVKSMRGGALAPAALELLVAAMGDVSWRVRREAAEGAAAWPDPARASELLVEALSEPENVGRRNALVEAVVRLGRAALPSLLTALREQPSHRKLLVDALGAIGDPAATAALVGALEDADPNVRIAAAEALGSAGGSDASAALVATLGRAGERRERLLQLAVLDALNRKGAQLEVATLLPLLEEAPLVAGAVEALGRSRDESASAALIRMLSHQARSVREAALMALRTLYAQLAGRAQETVKAALGRANLPLSLFAKALAEGPIGVRRAAATVLGISGQRAATLPLVSSLGDPDVRDAALDSLVMLGDLAFDTLLSLLPDLGGALRAEVYAVLPRLGLSHNDARVQSLLIEGLEDDDEMVAMRAAEALGDLGAKESVAPLFRALDREGLVGDGAARALGRLGGRHYDEVRILIASRGLDTPIAGRLCRILGACGRAADLPFLRVALGSESPQVRRAAAEALSGLGSDGDADSALVFGLADESLEVRVAAARALGVRAVAAAVVPLGAAARDGETAVKTQATRALGAIALRAAAGDRLRALEALRELADGEDPTSAVPALEALIRLQLPEDERRLLSALHSADPETVKVAVLALGNRPQPLSAARPGLERALDDARWDVRRAAAHALGALGGEGRAALLTRREHERDSLVNAALDAALAQMGR